MMFNSLVTLETPIRRAINLMGSSDLNKRIAGIAVIIDDEMHVIGIVTDGDVRRGLAKGISIDQPVSFIANLSPVLVSAQLTRQQMRQDVIRQAKQRQTDYLKYQHIVLINSEGKFHDVIRLSELTESQIENSVIAVYGLGFVGLTLAAALANSGMLVVGIDSNPDVIDRLKQGKPTFFENGLESLLDSLSQINPIHFTLTPHKLNADIHIICVGTPVDCNNSPDFTYVTEVTQTIASILNKGDLVILRSTLPVGTTRQLIIPILEKSGMQAGIDFFISFAPERTVEGNALEELRILPQIIGGLDNVSCQLTARVFNRITRTIVEVESLEAAEMVKLLNNTYRDLVFSFANEVSRICDGLNVNAFKLIEAANEGYPRNPIPMPSPGVGGICLAKDPYLYTNPYGMTLDYRPTLGKASRSINANGHLDVLRKIQKFCEVSGKQMASIKILLIGLAFKGIPETSDIRESIAIKLISALPKSSNIRIKDFVLGNEEILALGCQPVENFLAGFNEVDVVLVMNNHPSNSRFNIVDAFKHMSQPFLIFDGWNMFDQRQIESLPGAYYATLGYITDR